MTLVLAIENGGYVGAAYAVFLILLLVYVAIMAAKLSRIQRELSSLAELAEHPPSAPPRHDVGEIRERERAIETVREGNRG